MIEASNLAAILGMAAATLACRAGGYFLFRALRPTPFLRAMLGYVPGTLFVGYVAPALAAGGVKEWLGAGVTLLTVRLSGNIALGIIAGTASAWLVWLAR
jgi:uncharacterized membrane protein